MSPRPKQETAAGAPATHKVKTWNEGFDRHGKQNARDADATISIKCAGIEARFNEPKTKTKMAMAERCGLGRER